MTRPNLVLVHGWGLNKAVWDNIVEPLSAVFEVHCLSLPGYGELHNLPCPKNLEGIAECLLDQAPESAHWCGWSLGGMASISAALQSSDRIISLSLLCTTPKFVSSEDWQHGTDIEVFEKFSKELATDYQRSIRRFLLLQAGATGNAKTLAKQALVAMDEYHAPNESTLQTGLDILNVTDLRTQLENLMQPCLTVGARRDRVVPPAAGSYLASRLNNSDHFELNSGHAPHLSDPDALVELLIQHHNNPELETGVQAQ